MVMNTCLSISWGAVIKISILMTIIMLVKTFIKCMHDKSCLVCKKKD